MSTAIRVIGIVIVAIGVVYILKPSVMKRLFEFFKKGNRLYVAAPIRLALGVVFLLGARECNQPWVIFAFGILLLISGILVLVLGPKKLVPIIEWFQKQSEILARAMALLVLAIGVVIIISA
ncbi:MAG: hypothetical protein ACYTDW_09480 [Planctomycetota bacterium]|jgi:hypothetical protein